MEQIYKKVLLSFIIALPVLSGCERLNNFNREPLVKVYDSYLYKEDIAGMFPANISREDSLALVKNYIDQWVRNQLLLRLAERNLPSGDQDLGKKIADFRAALLIHKYQQYLLDQRLDSMISIYEIDRYYADHGNNFILEKPAISGFYMKLPLDTPGRGNIRTWHRSPEGLERIEDLGERYATINFWFNDSHLYLDEITRELPPGTSGGWATGNADHIEATDSEYYYFVGIREFLPARSPMPLSIARHKIESIILNKRKMQFLIELEKSVMNEGLNKNAIKYF